MTEVAEPSLLIDKIIKKNRYIFLCIGLNIRVKEKTLMDKYCSWFTYIFNFFWFITDTVGAIFWIIEGVTQKKNFTELTFVAPCVITCWLCSTKTFYMMINEDSIDKLINSARKFEIEQKNRPTDRDTDNIIREEYRYLNRVLRILYIIYSTLLIAFFMVPIITMFLKYLETNEVELILPFLLAYPFDPFDIRIYPWVFLRQIWSEIIIVGGIGASDCIFYIFCVYLRIEFLLLKHYIERLVPLESDNCILYEEEIKLKLIELIKWHQKIMSSVDVLETVYARSTLFNFVASSLLICFTGFDVVAIDGAPFVLPFISFLMFSLLQIFYLCFFGNLLMESSMAVGDAIYNSKWYSAPSLGKSLLLMQIRAQTPCKLTAAKFADVNLKAFMKICSTAWSYFALLQTLYSPSQ